MEGVGLCGEKRFFFLFSLISSSDMSKVMVFGMLNSNLDKPFGSHSPGGVHRRGGIEGIRRGLYFF